MHVLDDAANAEQLNEHARAEAGQEGRALGTPATRPAHILRLDDPLNTRTSG